MDKLRYSSCMMKMRFAISFFQSSSSSIATTLLACMIRKMEAANQDISRCKHLSKEMVFMNCLIVKNIFNTLKDKSLILKINGFIDKRIRSLESGRAN